MNTRTFLGVVTILLAVSFLGRGQLEAVEFLRGDVNGDGEVTISDSHALFAFLFGGLALPDCAEARDWDASGKLDEADGVAPLVQLFGDGTPPPPPFPDKGSAEALLGCREYEVGSPLEDPQARLTVLSAEASGGEDGYATIVLGASHSTAIAGHSFELRVPGEIVAGVHARSDLTGNFSSGFNGGRWLKSDTIRNGFLVSLLDPISIPASEGVVPIYELVVCLREGTTAGEYPIQIEAGEFADAASGRAIKPALGDGTLTVRAQVTVGRDCPESPSLPPEPPSPLPQPYEFLYELGASTEVRSPESIAADSRGRIIVAKGPGWSIPVFDSGGSFLFEIPSRETREFKRVMVDGKDRIIVTEPHRLRVFDPEGEFLFTFGTYGSGDGELNYPSATVDRGGRFIVTNPDARVQVFDPEGHFLFRFGRDGTGDGEFRTPGRAAADSAGRIIVPDLGNRRLQVFDSEGHFLFKFGREGEGEGEFQFISSVQVDSSDRMIVADRPIYHRVQVFNRNGQFLFKLWKPPEVWWEYWALPANVIVAVDRLDRIVMWLQRRLQVFAPEGRFLFDLKVPSKPTAIAADHSYGRIMVGSERGVEVFGPDTGESLFEVEMEPGYGELRSPRAVTVDSTGRTIVMSENRVLVFDSEGNFLFAFGGQGSEDGEFRNPEGIAVDSLDSIIVADTENNRIQIFDREGQFLFSFQSGLRRPNAVAVNSADQIIVTHVGTEHVQVFDFVGNWLFGCGKRGDGDGDVGNPSAVAVDSADSIIVVDAERGRVQVFDFAGNWLFGFGDGEFRTPSAVAVDSDDRIIVADAGRQRIQVFDPEGKFLLRFGRPGTKSGDFSGPRGVAVDRDDRIIVADTGNHRVQVFGLEPEGLQLPGDCNSDGELNLSDGICLLGYLFQGNPSELPCGDGTIDSPGNMALLDSNGDDVVNLSDGVVVFGFLFAGGPAPVLGTECVPIVGCPAACGE